MILLEFHFPETFTKAKRILEATNATFAVDDNSHRPRRIWYFESDLHTPQQKAAHDFARTFAKEDRLRYQAHQGPHLAEPPA